MTVKLETTREISLAATVAPEDLRPGDFISVLNETFELPSFLWADSPIAGRDELVRIRCCASGAGAPLKVKAICLPFVFVKTSHGFAYAVDVRRVQLVRLQKQYVKASWKKPKSDSVKAKRKKSKNKKKTKKK